MRVHLRSALGEKRQCGGPNQTRVLPKCRTHNLYVAKRRHCPPRHVGLNTRSQPFELLRQTTTHDDDLRAEDMEEICKAAAQDFCLLINKPVGERIAMAGGSKDTATVQDFAISHQ